MSEVIYALYLRDGTFHITPGHNLIDAANRIHRRHEDVAMHRENNVQEYYWDSTLLDWVKIDQDLADAIRVAAHALINAMNEAEADDGIAGFTESVLAGLFASQNMIYEESVVPRLIAELVEEGFEVIVQESSNVGTFYAMRRRIGVTDIEVLQPGKEDLEYARHRLGLDT